MTTIAYKDGVIAYDSRVTAGNTIITDKEDKRHERDGVSFFVAGDDDGIQAVMDAYFGKREDLKPGSAAFVCEGSKVIKAAICGEEGYWTAKLDPEEFYALGSGSDHAVTAMDMGATAEEAVRMAMKRDCCTGGEVRTFEVPK